MDSSIETSPKRPLAQLLSPLTHTYKALPNGSLNADIYLPSSRLSNPPSPILLFIHGGSWISGSRKDFPPAYFHEFLARNFVVVSIDYRLLPESSFLGDQLQDIEDVEPWIRGELPEIMNREGKGKLDGERVVVLGLSAGAHLALLTVCI
jgi:acetyl esterase/lipase